MDGRKPIVSSRCDKCLYTCDEHCRNCTGFYPIDEEEFCQDIVKTLKLLNEQQVWPEPKGDEVDSAIASLRKSGVATISGVNNLQVLLGYYPNLTIEFTSGIFYISGQVF